MAGDGASKGTTNSLYFADRGGLLTRAGLVALGVLAAAGSVDNVKTERTIRDNGDGTVTVHSVTTGTFNAKNAAAAQEILDAATDPHQNFDGLTGALEIASQKLGGDTDGWRFDFGYAYAKTFASRWGWEWSAMFGFGEYTMYHRNITLYHDDTGMTETHVGNAGFDFLGIPVRAGVTYRVAPKTTVEAFGKVEYNFWPNSQTTGITLDPSPWIVGGRFTIFDLLYAEANLRFSSMRSDNVSYGLEAGFAF